MSIHDLSVYRDADDTEKLGILRSELRNRIATARGFSDILKKQLLDGDIADRYNKLIILDKVIESIDDMDKIITLLTDKS